MTRPLHQNADGTIREYTDDEMAQLAIDQAAASAEAAMPPDGPTLGDWRTALVLWDRLDQIDAAIAALKASSDATQSMLGRVAEQRFQYSNNVLRAQLMTFKDMLGFTDVDVDESLWRANRVSLGDLSGIWPLHGS